MWLELGRKKESYEGELCLIAQESQKTVASLRLLTEFACKLAGKNMSNSTRIAKNTIALYFWANSHNARVAVYGACSFGNAWGGRLRDLQCGCRSCNDVQLFVGGDGYGKSEVFFV